jgi:DNA-binding Lrp family transcriptional regulator
MPSYVELGEKVGISRQTASTRTKELFDEGLIEKSDNKIVV